MYVWTTDPSPLQQKLCDAMMGAKTSNYSEHGLTLERPRGLWAAMSNMGKILAVSPHEEKVRSKAGGFYMAGIVRTFRAGLVAPKFINVYCPSHLAASWIFLLVFSKPNSQRR